MSWTEHVQRGYGAVHALLVVDALDKAFLSGRIAMTGLPGLVGVGPTQLKETLVKDSVKWAAAIDIRTGDARMPGNTFQLKDLRSSDGSNHVITSMMQGRSAALSARLAEPIAVGETNIEVDSTTGWPSSGRFWVNQSCYLYDSIDATHFIDCEPEQLFTNEVPIDYVAGVIEPRLYDRAITWVGRHVRLFIARERADGTLSTPQCRWRGKIKTAPKVQRAIWSIPCESSWDTLNSELLSSVAETAVIRYTIDFPGVDYILTDPDLSLQVPGVVTLQPSYDSVDSLISDLEGLLNNAISLLAPRGPAVQFRFFMDGDIIVAHRVYVDSEADPELTGALVLTFHGVLQHVFGAEVRIGANTYVQPVPDPNPLGLAEAWRSEPVPSTIVQLEPNNRPTEVDVEDASRFVVIDEDGDTWHIRSAVIVGDAVFNLHEVDGNTITISALVGEQAYVQVGTGQEAALVGGVNEELKVRQALILSGFIPDIWQQFFENVEVPNSWRGGINTGMFDWDEMAEFAIGGDALRRYHILRQPTSFRDLFLEDMRFAGLLPNTTAAGLISWRPLGLPTTQASVGVIDETTCRRKELPTSDVSELRPVTAIKFMAQPRVKFLRPYTIQFVAQELEGEIGPGVALEISAGGIYTSRGVGQLQNHTISVATKMLSLFGGETLKVRVPCHSAAGLLLTGDYVTFTHQVVPDLVNGRRGVESLLGIVTSVVVKPLHAQVDVELLCQLDQTKRAGFGPAAFVASYTDNGGGAGSLRYQLTLGNLQTYNSHNEGLDFRVGGRIKLIEWNDFSLPEMESLIISAINDAGTIVYVTTEPTNAASIGTPGSPSWIIVLDNYDTSGMLAADQEAYAFIAAEATGELGSSGDLGYRPT